MKKNIKETDDLCDGYYDDVKPEDYKERKKKPQKDSGLKYKILFVLLGALALIMISAIIMDLT